MTDTLIEVPGPEAVSRTGRGFSMVALAAMAVTLVGTAAIDLIHPLEGRNPVGREALDLNEARKSKRILDGTAARWVEAEMRQRSRVREVASVPWSALLLLHGGAAPTDLVVGEDGWLFLRRRAFLPPATRDLAIRRTAAMGAAAARRMEALGSEFVLMPIPRKAVIARHRFPSTMDPDRAHDEAAIRALESAGVATLDLLTVAESISPDERYLRLDSHWAPAFQEAAADALAEQYPDWVAPSHDFTLDEVPVPPKRDLLTFASIPRFGRYADWFGEEQLSLPRLFPVEARSRVLAGDLEAEVGVVGSSFTKGHFQAEILTARLGRWVYNGGAAAAPFFTPLAAYVAAFAGRSLPARTVYEFPLHELFDISRGGRIVGTGVGQFFAASSDIPTEKLPDDLGFRPVMRSGDSSLRAVFPPGTVLTSGDGAAHIVVEFSAEAETKWVFFTEVCRLFVTAQPGANRLVLPVLETDVFGSRMSFHALNPAARAVELQAHLGTDSDLSAATSISMAPRGARSWAFGPEPSQGSPPPAGSGQECAAQELLVLQWEGSRAEKITVSVVGTRKDGSSATHEVVFVDPRATSAFVNLDRWAGGSIESVELKWTGEAVLGNVQARIAPLLTQ